MKFLITGFEPFGGYTENSSWVAAKEVATRGVSGVEIAIERLPVSFSRAAGALREAIAKHLPDVVIMLGQTTSTEMIRLERVALNMMDASTPDNDGYIPDEEPIAEGAAAALFTPMPIKALRAAMATRGVAVKISNSCGLYVCNRLYYEALTLCCDSEALRALFVHLPLYDGQKSDNPNNPTMSLEAMVEAIRVIIEEINDKDREV